MRNVTLSVTVFITGAVTMIFELVGSRVMAPYYGTSLFTWTSLIGIILGSLSIGYWIGGRLADKKTSLRVLSSVLLISSLLFVGIYLFSTQILIAIFLMIHNPIIGTFIASTVLFSLPSIVFGIIPPYVAKIKIRSLKGSGKAIGNVYVLSTVGSIVGTFFTGYFLLSFIGSFDIILLLALILLINSFFLDFYFLIFLKISLFFVILSLFALNIKMDYSQLERKVTDIVSTSYSDYFISERESESGTTRNLINSFYARQSGYIIGHNDKLLVAYTKYFTFPACYGENQSVLMLGGGGFSYAKYFLEQFKRNKLDVVEIDPNLTQIAEEYFQLSKSRPNVTIINTDGRVYINQNDKKYNAIIVDAFQETSTPFHLTTKEAMSAMYRSLSQNGVLIINVNSPLKSEKMNLLDVQYHTLKSVFPNIEVYKVKPSLDSKVNQNVILIAYKKSKKNDLPNTCLFTEEKLLSNKIFYKEKKDSFVLTDNFAPVEFISLQ